jgi:hypothetical protein
VAEVAGNRQAEWIVAAVAAGAVAGIASVTKAFPAEEAEEELSEAAAEEAAGAVVEATAEAAREPAVLGVPPAWVPEVVVALGVAAQEVVDGGGRESHDQGKPHEIKYV